MNPIAWLRDRLSGKPVAKSRDRALGDRGEDEAVRFPKKQGYRIVERNVELGVGEIDIVATEGKVLCFIEVKTRRTVGGARRPGSNLTESKKRKIERAARRYVNRKKPHALPRRFDFVAVVLPEATPPQITLTRAAWDATR